MWLALIPWVVRVGAGVVGWMVLREGNKGIDNLQQSGFTFSKILLIGGLWFVIQNAGTRNSYHRGRGYRY